MALEWGRQGARGLGAPRGVPAGSEAEAVEVRGLGEWCFTGRREGWGPHLGPRAEETQGAPQWAAPGLSFSPRIRVRPGIQLTPVTLSPRHLPPSHYF